MRPLPDLVTHPELCAEIVKQFAFMKLMSKPEDNNFEALLNLDLNEVFNKADECFVNMTFMEELIDARASNLEDVLFEFLSQYKHVTDVVAIQQNVHYSLLIHDKD